MSVGCLQAVQAAFSASGQCSRWEVAGTPGPGPHLEARRPWSHLEADA